MNLHSVKNQSHAFLLCVLYALLYWSYDVVISVHYKYYGFLKEEPSIPMFFGILAIIVIISKLVSFLNATPFIHTIGIILIALILLPNLVMFQYGQIHVGINASIVIYIFCLIVFGNLKWKVPKLSLSNKYKIFVLTAIVLILMVPVFMSFGTEVNLNNLLLAEIYDTRILAREKKSFLIGYLDPWITKVLLPILFVYCLAKKKWVLLVFSSALILYMFLTGAHKTVLFSIAVIWFFAIVGNYRNKLQYFLIGSIVLLLLSRSLYYAYDFYLLDTGFTRRLFFVPALLNKYYFSFFEDNPMYLSHSILRYFIDYPYEFKPANLIGELYWGSSSASANNGLVSDGYMNFGYVGVVLFGILSGLYFSILNSLRIHHFFFGVVFLYLFSLISGAFLTSLLTKGGILLVIVSYIFLSNTSVKWKAEL